MIAELIREAALEGVRDELPHSLAVMVEEITQRESVNGRAARRRRSRRPSSWSAIARRASSSGTGGSRLKDVGTRARAWHRGPDGQRVYLDMRVKVAKDWQRDPKQLGRLGF